jgi:hypothetical protein
LYTLKKQLKAETGPAKPAAILAAGFVGSQTLSAATPANAEAY